jgi:hypothetical protein
MTRRWRRRAKWTGTVAAALIALAWFASGWYIFGVDYQGRTVVWVTVVGYGAFRCDYFRDPAGSHTPQRGAEFVFAAERRAPRPTWSWPFRWQTVAKGTEWDMGITLPLWVPFLAVAAPTLWIWHRDRGRVRGACVKCGYDLTGAPGGTCPECGAAHCPPASPS